MQDYQAGENVRRLYHQRPAPLQGQRLGQWFMNAFPKATAGTGLKENQDDFFTWDRVWNEVNPEKALGYLEETGALTWDTEPLSEYNRIYSR